MYEAMKQNTRRTSRERQEADILLSDESMAVKLVLKEKTRLKN
jgi:hypothetical protein